MQRRLLPRLLMLAFSALASSATRTDGTLARAMAAQGELARPSQTRYPAWAKHHGEISSRIDACRRRDPSSFDKLARLRGGVKRASAKADDSEDDDGEEDIDADGTGAMTALKGVFTNMPPATRVYVLVLLAITAVHVSVGTVIDSGNTFSMDWGRTLKGLELWRPLTSLVFLGPLSMGWLTNVYFLTQHGTRLELVSGTAEQVIFLMVVGLLLLVLGPWIGMSFLSTPMVAAHTYVSARMDPLGAVQFQFLRIPMWTLPFAQMGAAVLQQEGQPSAAIPHLVGILCGHVYHFFTVIHPLMGAKRRLGAPGWMKRRLDGGDNPNFMEAPQEETAAPRGRRIGAGKTKSRKTKPKAKKDPSMSRPLPDFPTAGSSCS